MSQLYVFPCTGSYTGSNKSPLQQNSDSAEKMSNAASVQLSQKTDPSTPVEKSTVKPYQTNLLTDSMPPEVFAIINDFQLNANNYIPKNMESSPDIEEYSDQIDGNLDTNTKTTVVTGFKNETLISSSVSNYNKNYDFKIMNAKTDIVFDV